MKIRFAATAIVASLTMIGCSTTTSKVDSTENGYQVTTEAPADTTTPATTESPVTLPSETAYNPTRTDELMMITAIEQSTGTVEGWDFEGQTAIDTGYLICANLRTGMSIEEIVVLIMASASDDDTTFFLTALTAGAITFLCPDMAYLLG